MEPVLDCVHDHLTVYCSEGFRERDSLGADLHAILRVVAIFDAARAHQRFESPRCVHGAGGMQVEQAHLTYDCCADEMRMLIDSRADFEAIATGDAARE